ncbi:hypothetical protein AAG906_016387 [Vitis piasezkii]
MVVEESIHVIFDESNNSLQERESFDDDLGLETSMGKLQIEDKRQQEESGEDPKKEESPLALPPPQQVQGESSQDLPKDWKFVINHPQDQIIGNPSSGCMHSEFEMSMMGELNFFLGLQIKQLKEGTFINQAKYIKDLLKRFNMEEAKVMKTPMSSSIKLDMDEKGKSIDSTIRPDIMYSVCLCARFQSCPKESHLRHSLVSWHSKKQNSVALSTAEAEYIATACLHFGFRWLLEGDGYLQVGAAPSPLKQLADRGSPKARYDTALFGSRGLSRYKTHFAKKACFPTLVRAFYSRMTYGLGGPIRTTVRGVEIELSPESICRILDIPPVGLRVYEAKAWPTIPGFEPREAIQRLCGLADAHGMGKPSAHSLTVPSRVLHHMICSILLPRGGHRDESTTRVLPYGRFLTRVFKDVGIDLSVETEFEAPSIYDTYDEHSLGRMKLEKAPDGSWVRKAERQARGHDQLHPGSEGIHFEATFSEPMMTEPPFTAGPSSQPSFTELPSQAPHAPDHPPWMDLSAQISSLGTRMEELAVVHDTRFYSMEDRIDQYQAGFTSQFEHLVQRIEHLESRQESQHEEMMAYLHSPSFLFDVAKGGDINKRIGFQGQKAHPVEDGAKLNRLRNRRPVPLVRSRSGRGGAKHTLSQYPVEATVTCYALNAPTASDPVDPLLVRSRLLSADFVSRA